MLRSVASRCDAGELRLVSAAPRPAAACVARRVRVPSPACAQGSARAWASTRRWPRLTFALLAFAGGAGIVAYGGAWLAMATEHGPQPSPRRRLLGFVTLAIAGAIALRGFGFSDSLDLARRALRRRHPARARTSRSPFLRGSRARGRRNLRVHRPERNRRGPGCSVRAGRRGDRAPACTGPHGRGGSPPSEMPSAPAGSASRSAPRWPPGFTTRCSRSSALVQRESHDPRRVATLARRQERELRAWLYPSPHVEGAGLAAADRERRGGGGGVARSPGRARPDGRRAAGRAERGNRSRSTGGDGEAARTLGRGRDLDLCRRRRRRDGDLRPRPWRRASTPPRCWPTPTGSQSRFAAG